MPLKSSKNNRYIQSIHSAPKMRSTGLEMAKNQGLDPVYQNKKNKNKNKKFREKAAEGHVGVYGDAPMPKRCPFPASLSVTNMSLFVAYGGEGQKERQRAGAEAAAAGGSSGSRRQQAAGRHGRGLLRASLYIAQKGGGRPARRIGSTAGRAERQAERRGRAAGGTAGGGANWSSIILLFIIIIYTIHS